MPHFAGMHADPAVALPSASAILQVEGALGTGDSSVSMGPVLAIPIFHLPTSPANTPEPVGDDNGIEGIEDPFCQALIGDIVNLTAGVRVNVRAVLSVDEVRVALGYRV